MVLYKDPVHTSNVKTPKPQHFCTFNEGPYHLEEFLRNARRMQKIGPQEEGPHRVAVSNLGSQAKNVNLKKVYVLQVLESLGQVLEFKIS